MLSKKILTSFLLISSLVTSAFAADKYEIDPAHSAVSFSVKHLVITNAKGNFKDFSGVIIYDDKKIENSTVDVKIKTASINTENEQRDTHLKGADFFDAAKYPEITFKSKQVKKQGKGYVCIGTLSMHGVSKEITIPFNVNGVVKDPWGGTRIGTQAVTALNRKDYGLTWNKTLDNGGLAVGEDVNISLDVEAIKK
jgi:polyisoprenoid-binding protein YceI